MKARIAALALLALPISSWLHAAPVKPDEQVMFLPQLAAERGDGTAALRIEAWVYEFEPRRLLHASFARYLDIDETTLPQEQRQLFHQRIQLFRVDSERRKVVDVALPDGRRVRLPRTRADGRSGLDVTLQVQDASPWIPFSAVLPEADPRQFHGRALRVPPQGWSVVSDIDDTIKHSDVADRRELLLNTFARPFRAVPGMAQRYGNFAQADAATRFHYVSTSPLQLLPALSDFLVEAGFPEGSMHLREATRWRALLADDEASAGHKRAAIQSLLATFPHRRFVLIGDSGEHDPEIYADLARHHPGRIALIAIRRVDATPDAEREATAQHDTGDTRWQWFDAAAELRLEPH